MKHLLLTTIAAVVLVGCGEAQLTAKAPDISIHEAASDGNIEAVKQHLDAGADVNAKNEYGETPLHEAIFYFHKETAELLIAKGADVNAKSDDGSGKRVTPLDMAILNDETEIADLLRKHGGKTGEELSAAGN